MRSRACRIRVAVVGRGHGKGRIDPLRLHRRCPRVARKQSKSDTLTVISNRWAYCSFDARTEGHQWHETEGLTIDVLRSGLPQGRLAKLPAEDRSR